MAKSLVVVESPAKAKTINKYLGQDYKVIASMGHVRDLPMSKLGVDVDEDFEPTDEVIASRKKALKELKDEAKKATTIFMATDPDREGEAIGWHLAEELGAANTNQIRRLLFNEITKTGVLAALDKPMGIDKNMVDAQQARRVLDRLVGYKISSLLWNKVRRGLSAGRVQSAALKLVCDREREIGAFVPEEYWTLTALACSGYPKGGSTRELETPDPGAEGEIEEGCEHCGKPMAIKRGRFGEFTACSSYPTCKYVKQKTTGVLCPKDGGDIVERESRRGKVLFGCANYPDCIVTLWNRPIAEACPACKAPFLVEKITKKNGRQAICNTEECSYVRSEELAPA